MGTFTFLQPLSRWKTIEYYAICMCVCSLRYPACNAHAPYYYLLPVPLYKIFTRYLINCEICKTLEQKILIVKRLFQFSLQHLPATFFILWGS